MNLIGHEVYHKIFGNGKIIDLSNNIISVEFNSVIKKLSFPDVFDEFMKLEDSLLDDAVQIEVKRMLDDRKKLEVEKVEALERNLKKDQFEPLDSKINSSKSQRSKTVARANIAFKCNKCDGGKSDNSIGFKGICSDEMIDYNIRVAHHTWCSSEDCPCYSYYRGDKDRNVLEEEFIKDGFICYESQMLINWKAMAGIVQTGENKNRTMKLKRVQSNSLCVLTTREPFSKEKDRYIFGVFLADESFEGDSIEAGYVSTDSEFKIELAPNEATQMKFWNYHSNSNKSEIASWNSGLHRYFDDQQAIQILRDMAKLKKGTPDEIIAERLLNHFAKINAIDTERIDEPNGALMRKAD
ncbi:MAG: hypothetical protein IBX70_13550 [Clostridia bacterium]|nr:hypothetical protein [Clostridia bacterium]